MIARRLEWTWRTRLRHPLAWLVWRFGPVRTPFHYDASAGVDATRAFERMAADRWCRRFVVPSGVTFNVHRTIKPRKPIELIGGAARGEDYSEVVFHVTPWLHFESQSTADPSLVTGFRFSACEDCLRTASTAMQLTLGEWFGRVRH